MDEKLKYVRISVEDIEKLVQEIIFSRRRIEELESKIKGTGLKKVKEAK